MKDIRNNNNEMTKDNILFQDACNIIEQAQVAAYRTVNETLIKRNWLLGFRIQHEVLKDQRAEYGERVIDNLAKRLTEKYGSGYSRSNLYNFIAFYQNHKNIFQSTTGKSGNIVQSVPAQSEIISTETGLFEQSNIYNSLVSAIPLRLSWSHYSIILQEQTAEGRAWYENEAAKEMWSTRTLQRNVSSQYYHRLLQSQNIMPQNT